MGSLCCASLIGLLLAFGPAPEAQAQVTLSVSAPANENEGNSGTRDLTFTVTLSSAASLGVPYTLCFSGTATRGTSSSFRASDDYQVTWDGITYTSSNCVNDTLSANTTSDTGIKIRVRGDTGIEANETVIAKLSLTPTLGITLGTSTATHTILNDDTTARVTSITRQTPSSSPTAADSLTWRVTFNEAVQNVDVADFQISGTTASLVVAGVDGTNAYDVAASGGDLAGLTGTVTLSFADNQNIQDSSGVTLDTTPTGMNQNTFVVDNTAPRVTSITRQTPSSSPTAADSLTWRVTFNEAVQNVDVADFQISGTTASLVMAGVDGTNAYDVTASGGDLAGLTATVTLSFVNNQNIEDSNGNTLTTTTPTGTNQNTFVVDNTAPRVTSITLQTPSSSPTHADSLTWRVTFNKAVQNVDATDFSISGTTASLVVAPVAGTNAYDVTASGGDLAGLNGTVVLSFADNQNIEDTRGNALATTTPTGANHNTFLVDNTFTLSIDLSQMSITEGHSSEDRSTVINYRLSREYSASFPFLACVDPASSTATHRTGSSIKAADFNLVNFASPYGNVPLNADGGNCHLYTYPANSRNQTFRLSVLGDRTAEGDERAVVSIKRASGTPVDVVLGTASATLSITNDDGTPPVITIAAGTSPVEEGTGASFTVNANTASAFIDLDVSVVVSQGGAVITSGNLGTKTITIPVNATSVGYTVATDNDMIDEVNGSVTVMVSSEAEGYTVGSPSSATVTVNDNDVQRISNTQVLVSNISKEESSSVAPTGESCLAQRFQTGTNPNGYNLRSIVLKVGSLHTSGTPIITVHENDGNSPGRVNLVKAVNPVAFTPNALHEFMIGEGFVKLDANTWYWIMNCHDGSGSGLSWVRTSENAGVDTGVAPGYNIASFYSLGSNPGGSHSLKMQIRGTLINAADKTAPRVTSIERQTPSTSPTDADSLTWRVTFNEAVQNVDVGDFQVSGTTASLVVSAVSGSTYDVTASGGDLAGTIGTVRLSFANGQNIRDRSGNSLADTTPTGTNDNTFVVSGDQSLSMHPVLVSNIAREESGSRALSRDLCLSQRFQTGTNTAGYNLKSVVLKVSTLHTSGEPEIRVYEDSSGGLGKSLYLLTNPRSFTANSPHEFMVPGNARLDASTWYWVRGCHDRDEAGLSWDYTSQNAGIDPGAAAGWTIESGYRANDSSSGGNSSLKVQIRGTPIASVDSTAPRVTSIERQTPSTSPTDADSLTWRVTFNEAVQNVDVGDFQVGGTSASLAVASVTGTNAYDVTASGGNLAGLSGTVTLSFANGQTIQDSSGNSLANTTPTGTNDNTFVVNNTPLPVITIAGGTSPVEEGEEASFTVNASPAPTTNLNVSVAVSQSGAFVTSGDRGTKTVIITANAPSSTYTVPTVNDMMDESNGSVTVTVNQGTDYTVGSTATATVTVNDNDTAAVNIGTATVMVTEAAGAGRTDSYTVVLATLPSHDVTITITVTSDDPLDNSLAATVSPATLTFTTSNWNSAQTVTVTGVNDEDDQTGNRRRTISHRATSSDGNYNGNTISIPDVTAAVVDDDGAGLVIDETGTPKRTEVSEDGTTRDTYRVVLATRPTHEVTVRAIASPGVQVSTGGAAAATATLTFTQSNWNSAQTVTVTGVDDATDDPGGDREVSINHTAISTDPDYSISSGLGGTVEVVVRDDDATTVILSGAVGNLEEGERKTFTITLGRGLVQGETLTVPLTFRGTATHNRDYTLSGTAATGVEYNNLNTGSARVVFTGPDSGATATMASITLSATADGVAESALETVDIGLGIITNTGLSNAGGVIPTASLAPFTITDGVLAGVSITESGGSTSVREAAGGRTDSYTVVLNSQPTASVTIAVTSSDAGAAMVSPPTLTFTQSNWSSAQMVTVTGVDDRLQSGNRSVTIRHSATSSHALYNGIPIPDVTATVVDAGTTGPSVLPVVELGAAAYGGGETSGNRTVNVVLSATPAFTAVTTVSYSVSGTATAGEDFTPLPGTVSITGGSATIPITILDDQMDDDGETIILTLTAANGYTVGAQGSTTITITDDDGMTPSPPPPTLPVVSITGGAAINEGEDARFTVTATPAPAAGEPISVNMRISASGDFASSGQTGSRAITIDASGTASFMVTTEDDTTQEEDGHIMATVQRGRGYTPHGTTASAAVTVTDDEVVRLSATSLRVAAGGSTSYQVALDDRPTADVTVTIRVGGVNGEGGAAPSPHLSPLGTSPLAGANAMEGGAAIRVHPATLTFTPTNWDRGQPVTLTAPEEGDLIGAAITLTHTATGGGHVDVSTTMTLTVVAAHSSEETKAWHLRLGRTLSHQVVTALQERWSTPPATGLQLTVAGEPIPSATALADHEGLLTKALGFETVTPQALVEGSSFSVAPEPEGGAPHLAFWGQGAFSSFSGEQETLSLDGDVTTLLLGADWHTEHWQAGAALSQSWGSGSYDGDKGADGEISSTVTGVFPYGRYALTPRLGLWAVAGYGWGQLSLKPDGEDEATPNTTMGMAAVGLDGVLLDGGSEGITLTTTADVLTLKTSSEEVDGLESSEGSLSRLRLGIEATRPFPLSNGASLLPAMEMGIRQDGGDAETGFGLDLGAGILWRDPERGISGSLQGRTLLAHGEEEFQEQGLALSFSWQPNPTNLGPSLSMGHIIGATAEGGMDALLNPTTMEGLDTTPSSGQRFAAKLAYGFPAHHNHITLTPALALALSPTSRNYSLLWSLAPYPEQLQGEPWQLSLAGQRQEQNTDTAQVDHSLKLTFSTLF